MPTHGYYRFPTIHKDTVVFVSEDDLWSVPVSGGVARRLTANLGMMMFPSLSPDGKLIAFTGREEGHTEVYVMSAEGGPVKRLTYVGATSLVLGWTSDGDKIVFSTDAGQAFDRVGYVKAVSPAGGLPEPLPFGPAVSLTFGPDGRSAIGRNNNDPARWKRYRGGTAGELWVDTEGKGEFHRLIELKGNVAKPMWIGSRIYFLSDHEGVGNIYSCLPTGKDLKKHTSHTEYFARFPSTDGKRIVYHSGADLYVFDPKTGDSKKVEVTYHSPRVQRQRKFADAARYLESYAPHPLGHSIAVTARGKSFTFGNWEGAVAQHGGEASPTRYKLTQWLNDGERVVTVADNGDGYELQVHHAAGNSEIVSLPKLDIGNPIAMLVSPTDDHLLVANHRNELIFVDLAKKKSKLIEKSAYGPVRGMDWSPDGKWAAYGFDATQYTTVIKLWNREKGESHAATEPILRDMRPAFDPEGKYLYFLGMRELNPVYDNLHFDLGFPRGMRPYLITLKKDARSPFSPEPRPLQPEPPKPPEGEKPAEGAKSEEPKPPAIEIDLDGITSRVVAFPVPEGEYHHIEGIKGKALFTSYPVEGALSQDFLSNEIPAKATLEMYDFESQKHEPLIPGITNFHVAKDGKTLYYRAGSRLRAIVAGAKPDEKASAEPPSRRSGWIDLGRVKVSIEPGIEWQQMAREAWRLQREHFWTEDMSKIDWELVWKRYSPLIECVGSRVEFSDLMWEMQGELGTSHAYEFGGDYRPEPTYPQGFLGADFEYEKKSGGYRLTHIVRGAAGEADNNSPLRAPGVNVKEGDVLLAINGRKLSKDLLPQEVLVHQAGQELTLTVKSGEETRDVTVKAIGNEFSSRYREWVEGNRKKVHEATNGRVGYVHIPDMGARGYAEFHRLYLTEVKHDAMIVDVRYNRGGHVSELLIEKLARKRVGYDVTRWGQPGPYPNYSVAGPMVALTNQWAGSDGDIFSHVWKLKDLGPLIGKRTWGGVVGIWPRNPLADGTITTQPEFSFWFMDVGWGVENYGTDPTVDIDITPQDYARGHDPQMEKAIALVLERLAAEPPLKPDFKERPNLSLPKAKK